MEMKRPKRGQLENIRIIPVGADLDNNSAGWDRDQAIKERDEARAELAAWKQARGARGGHLPR